MMIAKQEPAIRLSVDPTNPGQFFACCGLLELADKLWDGSEGFFNKDGMGFLIKTAEVIQDINVVELIDALAKCHITNTMSEMELKRLEYLSRTPRKEISKSTNFEAE